MGFDYKKEYKEFYLPHKKPGIVTAPSMNFLAVWGNGGPNEEGGAYKHTLGRPGFLCLLPDLPGACIITSLRKNKILFCLENFTTQKPTDFERKCRGAFVEWDTSAKAMRNIKEKP